MGLEMSYVDVGLPVSLHLVLGGDIVAYGLREVICLHQPTIFVTKALD